jgi:hypothetical protein
VTSAKIASGAVATADLAAGAVNGTKIADDAVAARHLETGAVDSAAILNGSITSADIGAGQVGTNAVATSSITTQKLATGAVTTSKIADGTITAEDVDPTGGVYASKQSVYAQSATSDIEPGFCVQIRANCLDTNDLPLQGWCVPEPGWTIWLRSMVAQDWTSLASESGWECDACLEGTAPTPQSITSTIVCISVLDDSSDESWWRIGRANRTRGPEPLKQPHTPRSRGPGAWLPFRPTKRCLAPLPSPSGIDL